MERDGAKVTEQDLNPGFFGSAAVSLGNPVVPPWPPASAIWVPAAVGQVGAGVGMADGPRVVWQMDTGVGVVDGLLSEGKKRREQRGGQWHFPILLQLIWNVLTTFLRVLAAPHC